RLTVRAGPAPARPPVRVVLDSALRTPPGSRLVAEADAAPLWVFGAAGASRERARELETRGVCVLEVPEARPGRVDLGAVLAELWRRDVRSLLVEGGAEIAASLLAEDRVDRLHLFYAPLLLGPGGLPAFSDVDPLRWRIAARHGLGRDTWLTLARS
ncbi:MAG: RibD family protein, partial [Gemmatimonadota bacterium]